MLPCIIQNVSGGLRDLLARLRGDPPRADDGVDSVHALDEEDDEIDEPTRGGGAAVRDVHFDPDAVVDEPTGCRPLFDLVAGGRTDPGLVREANEDALLLMGEQAVYVVADGMGGHAGGEIASQLAIGAIAAAFSRDSRATCVLSNVPPRAAELVQGLAAANEAIRSAAAKDPRLSDMGTTIVAARFCPNKGRLYIGHVGDSRCFRLRNGSLEQMTRDHTLAELGVKGRRGRYLSRAVGTNGIMEADMSIVAPRPGDVYLLCTDGLTKMVLPEAIQEVLASEPDPGRAASALVARAIAEGGRDNVTVLVVRVDRPSGALEPG